MVIKTSYLTNRHNNAIIILSTEITKESREIKMLGAGLTVNKISLVNRFYTEKSCLVSRERNTHTLGYQFSGSYRHFFGDRELTFDSDTLLFINKDVDYRATNEQSGVSISFHFTSPDRIELPCFALKCADHPDIKKIFLSAYDSFTARTQTSDYLVMARLYEAFAAVSSLEADEVSYQSSSDRAMVKKAVAYINEHLTENLSVKLLAAMSGKSERRFNDIFRNVTQYTPLEFINKRRIEQAKLYLESGMYSVSETAYALGFGDESYFIRLFRKKTGIPPGKYRDLTNKAKG